MRDLAPAYKGYRIYPRGFLGASLGEQIAPSERPAAIQLRTHTFHPDWFKQTQEPKEVNRNIEGMWRHMNETFGAFDNFEFREKVLCIALTAFGTSNFADWLKVQQDGPSTGDMHMEFLRDTFGFIMTGKRKMNLHNWTLLLSMTEITHNVTKDDGSFDAFFRSSDKRLQNTKLIDVIQRWCSQPSGFADLAQTLHVLFGEL